MQKVGPGYVVTEGGGWKEKDAPSEVARLEVDRLVGVEGAPGEVVDVAEHCGLLEEGAVHAAPVPEALNQLDGRRARRQKDRVGEVARVNLRARAGAQSRAVSRMALCDSTRPRGVRRALDARASAIVQLVMAHDRKDQATGRRWLELSSAR